MTGLIVATVITRLEGGAGALALRGALALDRSVVRPLIITGSSGGRLHTEAAQAGIEVIVAPCLKPVLTPRSDFQAVRWLRDLLTARRPDVVHTHCAKGGAIGRIAARQAGIARIVHTYHGFPFHEFQSPLRRRAYVVAERRLGRLTDVGLCTGTGVAVEAVRRRLIPPERVRTIGVTVDQAQARRGRAADRGARARARAALGIPASARVVGAVGRLTYQKAPEEFVTAIAALPPGVTGVWVGGGELAGSVARQVAASGHRVVLTGDRSDVADLLPAFDVFALPSRYEGLPTAIAEAMVCGVPVAATAVNAVADLVEPGVTGLLVPPGHPAAMASAIRYLLGEPAEAARMAAAARDRVGARYSQEALAEALEAAYQQSPGIPERSQASFPAVAGDDQAGSGDPRVGAAPAAAAPGDVRRLNSQSKAERAGGQGPA
jgi:glycosyltransferase involved in cell wall biosynthesis